MIVKRSQKVNSIFTLDKNFQYEYFVLWPQLLTRIIEINIFYELEKVKEHKIMQITQRINFIPF